MQIYILEFGRNAQKKKLVQIYRIANKNYFQAFVHSSKFKFMTKLTAIKMYAYSIDTNK